MKDVVVFAVMPVVLCVALFVSVGMLTTRDVPEQCYKYTVTITTQQRLYTNKLKFMEGSYMFTSSKGVQTLVPMFNILKIEDNQCEDIDK